MEKNEILALIGAVGAVLLLIFIMSKVRGEDEQPSGESVFVEPGQIIQTGAPETDIWDVLHAMNATEAESAEGETVAVTAIDDNGEVYTVTDEQGNAQTDLVPAAEPAAEVTTGDDALPADHQPGEPPVINVTPGQQAPAEVQPGDPYFVVVPADQ